MNGIGRFSGKHVLVVEDEPLVAMALEDELGVAGAIVIGPASTVEVALRLVDAHRIDAAVLDVRLHDHLAFPVADVLAARGIPFVFTTGLGADAIPPQYLHVPTCDKPASAEAVIAALEWSSPDDQE